jgi:hypothetical protein
VSGKARAAAKAGSAISSEPSRTNLRGMLYLRA